MKSESITQNVGMTNEIFVEGINGYF